MNWFKKGDNLKLLAIVFWLAFTVAFALWWLLFSVENISRLALLEPGRLSHWNRQERMVFWEGGSWLLLLIIGGAALIGLMLKERRRARQIKEFFASFSHEIKTSLASLRIQAEALKDEHKDLSSPIFDRLIGDTVRLQLQLENSLFLASQDNLQFFIQPLKVDEIIERLGEQWPNLKIVRPRAAVVRADERALRTILSNLLQNAIVHGGASQVDVEVRAAAGGRVEISVQDNGTGFHGATGELGQLFHRPQATSGSGLGLYICRILVHKMNGEISWLGGKQGFHVQLQLEGSLV